MTTSGKDSGEDERREPEARQSPSGAFVRSQDLGRDEIAGAMAEVASSDLYLDYATQRVVDEIEGEARVEDQVLKLAVLPEAKRRQVLGALSPGTQAKMVAFIQSRAPSSPAKSAVPAPAKSPSAAKRGCAVIAAALLLTGLVPLLASLGPH